MLISYVAVVVIGISLIFLAESLYPSVVEIDYSKFIVGFQTMSSQLRFDFFFIMTLLPMTVGLMLLSKNNLKHADSILILIFGTIIAGPLLVMSTYEYEILMYRHVLLLVFFSIGIGMLFSKKLVHHS